MRHRKGASFVKRINGNNCKAKVQCLLSDMFC